jgi:hypothetical protein
MAIDEISITEIERNYKSIQQILMHETDLF